MKKILVFLTAMVCMTFANAQDYKFGKVSKEELEEKYYPLDSTADAAYLYSYRWTYTTVSANNLQLITQVHNRIKFYNKEGFDKATEEVNLFGSEKASNFKAVTYNLEDGKIVETKLDKSEVFTEEINDSWKVKKFTMPNIKEGSVVEWTYKIYSPFISSIDDVEIQHTIPVKNLVAKVELMEWFQFRKQQKGYLAINMKEFGERNSSLNIKDNVILIEQKDIPALKEEPYVNNIFNYAAGLEFEVVGIRAVELGIYENFATSWEEIAKDVYKSPSFGSELNKASHLKDDMAQLKGELTTLSAKVFGGLEYVKNKIKWNDVYGEYTQKGVKKAFKEGSGNIADINLTLVTVLRELGLNANPVLVSSRSNGIPIYPTKKGINYVVAVVETNNGKILLDASEKYSLPNVLPRRALNWQGIIVREDKTVGYVDMESSSVALESTNLKYEIDEDGFIKGMNRASYKNLEAMTYRNTKGSLDKDDLISKVEQENSDIEIINFRVSNIDDISKPVIEMCTFEKEDGVDVIGDKIYVMPLLFLANTENPFKLDKREYPVDFGAPWQEKFVVNLKIPEGFVVESLPENVAVAMQDELGKFIYSVKQNGNTISITSLFEMNSGIIPPHNYEELKGFFNLQVEKQSEKIVLTKG